MGIEKHADALGSPDIKLNGFQLWIHSRQFPDAEDYWDGNWLNATAHCGTHGADVWTTGAIIRVSDIAAWLVALEEMYQCMSGEANLLSLEPELSVELSMNELGHVAMTVEITPDHMNQQHSFQFELDQSYLAGLITSCRGVLEKYPIKDKPDA